MNLLVSGQPLTLIAAHIALYPLGLLIDKAIECFFPEESNQPDSLVDSSVKVDGASAGRVPTPTN
ncbi:hypothetical protein [Wolbachia endosymbiont (group A) of Barypeithes pellucidus]|uniref:hypothetical protein n=1 Tax=Wolbachia endosymbiont (group A) of Barypeithes pellucidus TaxID=3139322 RepID=UPI003CCB0E4C